MASRKPIDMFKSFMITSPNVQEVHQSILHAIFTMKIQTFFRKYLGVPAVFEKSNAHVFNFLIEKVQHKLQGWKSKFLSPEGGPSL